MIISIVMIDLLQIINFLKVDLSFKCTLKNVYSMRINNLLTGILCGCLFFTTACSKSSLQKPEIHIISPVSENNYNSEHILIVEADILDDNLIDQYTLSVISPSGFVYFSDNARVNKDYCKLFYELSLSSINDKDIKFVLEVLDVDENISKKEWKVYFQ